MTSETMVERPITINRREIVIRAMEEERGRPLSTGELADVDAALQTSSRFWRSVFQCAGPAALQEESNG